MDIPSTDPVPYITAAYGIGIGLMALYCIWLFIDEKKLRALAVAIKQNGGPNDEGQ